MMPWHPKGRHGFYTQMKFWMQYDTYAWHVLKFLVGIVGSNTSNTMSIVSQNSHRFDKSFTPAVNKMQPSFIWALDVNWQSSVMMMMNTMSIVLIHLPKTSFLFSLPGAFAWIQFEEDLMKHSNLVLVDVQDFHIRWVLMNIYPALKRCAMWNTDCFLSSHPFLWYLYTYLMSAPPWFLECAHHTEKRVGSNIIRYDWLVGGNIDTKLTVWRRPK